MRRPIISLLLLLVLVACGPSQAQAPASPSAAVVTPSALPTPSGPALLAVLEAKGAIPHQWNTVAIAGLDGFARAKTTFVPMPTPDLGCMGAIIPPSAQVADGKVYFADGTGVVRSLAANGQIARVASFPFNGHQQMLSFAVSPDGRHVLGVVFTLPAKPNLACDSSPATVGYSLDVYSATSGGPSTRLYQENWTSSPTNVLALFGWDSVGPFGTQPTGWATQGGGPAPFNGGTPARVDSNTGKVLRQVDPSSCRVWAMAFSGDFVCITDPVINSSTKLYDEKVSVRSVDGGEIWQFTMTTSDGSVFNPFLAPDEQHVVVAADYVTEVAGRDGSRVKLGSQVLGNQFGAAGWLDSTTVIGSAGANLAYVRLSAPGTVVSLGFQGIFVGAVQT